MPFLNDSEDIRKRKTRDALEISLLTLLESKAFRKISVRDICEEARVSRSAFYAHYTDKYDLLRNWLSMLPEVIFSGDTCYVTMEQSINSFVDGHARIIRNIIEAADSETLSLVFECLLSLLLTDDERAAAAQKGAEFTVLSNFFAGGMIYYLLWHISNRFSTKVMNIHLYQVYKQFRDWLTRQP